MQRFLHMEGKMQRMFFMRRLLIVLFSLFFCVGTWAEDVIVMPEYPGGEKALQKFLEENLVYPTAARKMELSGEVVVEFTVERGGAISGVNVIKGLSTELDQEALRVVRSMSRWKPGTKNGVPVRVKMTLPINFKLRKVEGFRDESKETTLKKARNPFTKNRNKKSPKKELVNK